MIVSKPDPQFINSSKGRIFTLYFPANGDSNAATLIIPPFADEMNKSRRMFSELARRLSSNGQSALLFDFYGTGDSEGLFEDATWHDWLADIQSCVSLLYDKGVAQINLLAMRTGALLAVDFLNASSVNIPKLLLWQPVIDGGIFFNQFMRLRLVASMMSGDKNRETTKDLKARFEQGETLEIAGYGITPSIAASLEAATLKGFVTRANFDITWLDIVADAERDPPLVNRKLVEQWQQDGISVIHQKVVGMPFWNSTETVEIPELIDVSQRFLTMGVNKS